MFHRNMLIPPLYEAVQHLTLDMRVGHFGTSNSWILLIMLLVLIMMSFVKAHIGDDMINADT